MPTVRAGGLPRFKCLRSLLARTSKVVPLGEASPKRWKCPCLKWRRNRVAAVRKAKPEPQADNAASLPEVSIVGSRSGGRAQKLLAQELAEPQVDNAAPLPEEVTPQEYFLFSVTSTCRDTRASGQDTVPYDKELVAQTIVDIVDKHDDFLDPSSILRMSMEAIFYLSLMKPLFSTQMKRTIIQGIFYSIYELIEFSEDDNEDLQAIFELMLRGLLSEAPSLETLSSIIEDLRIYIEGKDKKERDLAASSLQWLLADALTFPDLTLESVRTIIPPELSWLCSRTSEEELVIEDLE
ncbi:uncharacterized protein LOC133378090 isoform X1 [Rhineura floridana]|uniref:uncharacterized protein LOC133378090 isoform X1 n=1 Tax=Rhineura floridana TaxID=261503 RepID=UPI002AC86907|nr:uncharacterized protein LOC133378090 isoform X1 [Rhineura floridana]